MTKKQLEEELQKAVEFGNEMVEHLCIMRDDEVISTYRRVRRGLAVPYLSMATDAENHDPIADLCADDGPWDCFVGELQRAGVVDKDLMAIPADQCVFTAAEYG